MSKKIQAIRGMNDLLPVNATLWQFLEKHLRETAQSYGYQEIRFPILESTNLFKRTVGDVTDIVEKEMYTFQDRNGDKLSLRPEGTAGCVRSCIEHGLLHNQTQKLWYLGPMYRHERPQKGRYRQFYQFGIEAFGYHGVSIELEVIVLLKRLWQRLGLAKDIELQINTIGSLEERAAFKDALVSYLEPQKEHLDEDSQRRLQTNPLRILDSKNNGTQALLKEAPVLTDFFSKESLGTFNRLQEALTAQNIAFTHNPRLVRGLDYYNHTVFEWVTDSLGAQGTVCAGGRYDGLVQLLGGGDVPAFGCALGIERLVLMLKEQEESRLPKAFSADLFAVVMGEKALSRYSILAEQIRDKLPHAIVDCSHAAEASFKSQFKKADKSGAQYALILGEEEVNSNTVLIKDLRTRQEQVRVTESELITYLAKVL